MKSVLLHVVAVYSYLQTSYDDSNGLTLNLNFAYEQPNHGEYYGVWNSTLSINLGDNDYNLVSEGQNSFKFSSTITGGSVSVDFNSNCTVITETATPNVVLTHDITTAINMPISMPVNRWYSGQERFNPQWPLSRHGQAIEKVLSPEASPTALINAFLGVQDSVWVHSQGYILKANDSISTHFTPLFFKQNSESAISLISKFDDFYFHELDTLTMKYQICNYENGLRETLKNTIYKSSKNWAVDVQSKAISEPVWSTWAIYKSEVNQTLVAQFSDEIMNNWQDCKNEQKCGRFEIDDKWQKAYGDNEFDFEKFPDPKTMVSDLKSSGFDVTLWTIPFVNTDSNRAAELLEQGYYVKNSGATRSSQSKVHWWDCGKIFSGDWRCGWIIDFSNPDAFEWQTKGLNSLIEKYSIDGFKFDAGEMQYLPRNWSFYDQSLTNARDYNTKYGQFTSQFGSIGEMRSAWKLKSTYPGWFRLFDLRSKWNNFDGLRSIIPKCLTFTIAGYPWVLPDMVGGNVGGVDNNTGLPERELYRVMTIIKTINFFVLFR